MIDLFNTLESFREFGLNGNLDLNLLISNSQVHTVVYTLFSQLSQRIPSSQKLNVRKSSDLICNWILETYDKYVTVIIKFNLLYDAKCFHCIFHSNQTGFINVFALKIALTLLCSATYSNKLRYFFTLLSNDGPFLIEAHFDLFVRYVLAIAQYFEDISIFFYDEDLHSSIFDFSSSINLQQFIDVLTCFENQADFTSWLIVYHRLADAELVTHQVNCNACEQNPFQGFRYKCKKCNNYNLCQDCFWSGKSSANHDPDKHPCKEYLFEKPKNQLRRSIRNSFRNSFRCVGPTKQPTNFSKQNENNLTRKQLNLKNIISSPLFRKRQSVTYEYRFRDLEFDNSDSISNISCDEEHALISHYLYLLNSKYENKETPESFSYDLNGVKGFEKTIENLENKNRLLMKQISNLKDRKADKKQRTLCKQDTPNLSDEKDVFFDELIVLRRKKDDLEDYLNSLQDKRKVLMFQLDNLMKEFQDFEASNAAPLEVLNTIQSVHNNNTGQTAMANLIQQFSSNSIASGQAYSNHSSMEIADDHDLVSFNICLA